jgi:predicted metal-dependent hydrolase
MAVAIKALWSNRPFKRNLKAQSEHVLVNDLSVVWRKSGRRKRSMALKVDKQGQLIAMTPLSTRVSELKQFVLRREAWIRQQLTQYKQLEDVKLETRGQSLWYLGEQLRVENWVGAKNFIEYSPGLIALESHQILDRNALHGRLMNWLRTQAELTLPARVKRLSQQTSLHGSGLQIKAYTARWGSCRHDRLIQLNWKLIQVPPEVIDYVVLHELCHLRHFNHSASFWRQLEQHCPDYRNRRKWLKDNGRLLISS